MITLNIKYLVSLQHHYFRYPADRGTAEKTFNSLNNKFDLKVMGSWGAMITKRSQEYIRKGARYHKTFVQYTFDKEIIVMITDAQGRIRESYKDVTERYYQHLDNQSKILSSSSTLVTEEGLLLKDLVRKHSQYQRYIQQVVSNRDGFIKPELQHIVYESIPSLFPNEGPYEQLQYFFIDHYHHPKYHKDFDQLINDLLVFSFNVLKENNIKDNDLPGLLYRLKHVYMSGRAMDPLLLSARQLFDKLVIGFDKKLKNKPLIPERCGFFLYLILRTVTMNKYK